jgi:tetratricopeptide (TPR) repeat protein
VRVREGAGRLDPARGPKQTGRQNHVAARCTRYRSWFTDELLRLLQRPFRRSKLALAYSNRGNVYDDKGDYERAIVDLNQAIRPDPKLADDPARSEDATAYLQPRECLLPQARL